MSPILPPFLSTFVQPLIATGTWSHPSLPFLKLVFHGTNVFGIVLLLNDCSWFAISGATSSFCLSLDYLFLPRILLVNNFFSFSCKCAGRIQVFFFSDCLFVCLSLKVVVSWARILIRRQWRHKSIPDWINLAPAQPDPCSAPTLFHR